MYRSFLPRVCSNDQVIVRMRGRGGTTIFWTLSREMDGGGWSFENVERIERLVPRVAHFVQVQQAPAAADARGDAPAALLEGTGLGVLHLDRRGRVLEANERARRVLAEADCLTQRSGQLHACARHEELQLGRLLTACRDRGVGGSMALWGSGGLRAASLILHVCPVPVDRTSSETRRVVTQVLLTETAADRVGIRRPDRSWAHRGGAWPDRPQGANERRRGSGKTSGPLLVPVLPPFVQRSGFV